VSAASGLVLAGESLYVVAHDELHLGVFATHGAGPGTLVRVFPGELPDAAPARKALKPDLEALALLPPCPVAPHGALLALGSASTRRRERGVLLPLGAGGAISGVPRILDLTALAEGLRATLGAVNVEGAVPIDDRLVLLQRGHRGGGRNALVSVPLAQVLAPDRDHGVHPAVCDVDIGAIDGVPLGFTDGTLLPDGSIAFSAIAEDRVGSYHDGPCAGAAVGIVGADGSVQRLERLEPPAKVEGIAAREACGGLELLLVTDADDAVVPASLYTAFLPERRGRS
jgi:hypothetical protein